MSNVKQKELLLPLEVKELVQGLGSGAKGATS